MVLSLYFIFTLSHIVNFTPHQGGRRSFDPTVRFESQVRLWVVSIPTPNRHYYSTQSWYSFCCPTNGRRLGWFTRSVLTHGHIAIQLPTEPGVDG